MVYRDEYITCAWLPVGQGGQDGMHVSVSAHSITPDGVPAWQRHPAADHGCPAAVQPGHHAVWTWVQSLGYFKQFGKEKKFSSLSVLLGNFEWLYLSSATCCPQSVHPKIFEACDSLPFYGSTGANVAYSLIAISAVGLTEGSHVWVQVSHNVFENASWILQHLLLYVENSTPGSKWNFHRCAIAKAAALLLTKNKTKKTSLLTEIFCTASTSLQNSMAARERKKEEINQACYVDHGFFPHPPDDPFLLDEAVVLICWCS